MSAAAGQPDGSAQPLLEVQDLRVAFPAPGGAVEAVDGISFAVAPGQTLGIVGESGSGKSVTALTVMGLTRRQGARIGGRIRLDGRDLLELDEAQLRALRGDELAMIFQDPLAALSPLHRVGWQLVEALRAHRPLPRRQARARALELLDLVGIPEPARRIDVYPHELSGGMRQRVAFVRTLLSGKPLLCLDEPFGALDAITRSEMHTWLSGALKQEPRTVVLVTHDVEEAIVLADRVAVVSARPGQVVRELEIDLARPRSRTDPRVVALREQALDALANEGAR